MFYRGHLNLFVMRMQVPIQDSKSKSQPKTPAHATTYQSNGPPSNLSSTGSNTALSPLNLTPSLTLV